MALPKTAPWAIDFASFLADSAKVDYADLGQHFRDSAWKYRLIQRSAVPTPDGGALIDTDILIGPDYDKLELFDTVTLKMPPNIVPMSLLVRQNIFASLLGAVFGRFPPEPVVQMAPPAPRPGQMNGGDSRPVNAIDNHQHPGEDAGEYVEDDTAPSVNVVAKREPDGLPIFVDLFAMDGPLKGVPAGAIIDSVLEEVGSFLALASSLEQIDALALKNPDMKAFIKDLGDEQDRAELTAMVLARRKELTVPAAAAAANAPRRRQRAQTN